jgi:hypothetical protein
LQCNLIDGSNDKNKVNNRTQGFSIKKLHCSAWDLEKSSPDKKNISLS